MQVFVDAAAARRAHLDGAPVFLMHQAHADLKHVLSEVATAEQEPSLAAARAAATALAAAHKALAGEALLASLTLSLAEASTPQVGSSNLLRVDRTSALNLFSKPCRLCSFQRKQCS